MVRGMLNIERALKQDRLFQAMTGLNRKAFDALLPNFSAVYEQTLLQQPRQRAIGGRRKARLRNLEDKLFYILFYFKSYPTFDLAGLLFEMVVLQRVAEVIKTAWKVTQSGSHFKDLLNEFDPF